MANNEQNHEGRYLSLGVGSALKSGAPIAVGQITGVLMIDALATSPYTATIDTRGVYNLLVDGVDENGNSAVAVGDIVYWDPDTSALNKDATEGIRFGFALGVVSSGVHTTTIPVKLGFG